MGFCCCHVTGSFAVICLMVAQVVDREVGSLSLEPSPSPGNVSVSSPTPTDTSSGLWTPIESVKIEIAISLSLLVGIIQVMYFHELYLRSLVTYFHPAQRSPPFLIIFVNRPLYIRQ